MSHQPYNDPTFPGYSFSPTKPLRTRIPWWYWFVAPLFGLCALFTILVVAAAHLPPVPPTTTPSVSQVVHTSTPIARPTAYPTARPTPKPTPMVKPTPKPRPTPTPRPTAIPTQVPTPPLAVPTPVPTQAPQPTQPPAPVGVNGNPWGYTFTPGNLIYSPPAAFCSYFACIKSFWESTNGFVSECNDGTYSHSGGRSGDCSDHGGEDQPLYSH
jgi:hypothetical protein